MHAPRSRNFNPGKLTLDTVCMHVDFDVHVDLKSCIHVKRPFYHCFFFYVVLPALAPRGQHSVCRPCGQHAFAALGVLMPSRAAQRLPSPRPARAALVILRVAPPYPSLLRSNQARQQSSAT